MINPADLKLRAPLLRMLLMGLFFVQEKKG